MTSTSSRKRCRNVVGLGVTLAAMWCNQSTAFTSPASLTSHRFGLPSSSVLVMAKQQFAGSGSNDMPSIAPPPRLSTEEQKELLAQAVELRRIKKLENELALPKKAAPLALVRCREAGYGEDLLAYENAISDGELARESLITTNMGLVHYCVNDIIGTKKSGNRRALNSLSREDLVQEGAIGLARAIDKWDPAIGGRFSTYAVYWVRAAVLRCIAEKDDMLRVPEHVSSTVRKMTKGARNLGLEIDGDTILSTVYSANAGWKEAKAAKALAEEAGLTDKQLKEALRIRYRRNTGGYVEFESWMQNGADIESDVSTLTSREEPSLRSVEREDLKKTLGQYLRPKEMEALCWRYGLLEDGEVQYSDDEPRDYVAEVEEELYGEPKSSKRRNRSRKQLSDDMVVGGRWGEAMSFKEVGLNMEVSAEYGRRLCHAALKKLRQAADDGRLEPALLF